MKSYTFALVIACLSFTALNSAPGNNNDKNNNSILKYIFSPVTDQMNQSTNKVVEQMKTSTNQVTNTLNGLTDGPSILITGSGAYANVKAIQFGAQYGAQNPRFALAAAGTVMVTTAITTYAYTKRRDYLRPMVIKNNSDQ